MNDAPVATQMELTLAWLVMLCLLAVGGWRCLRGWFRAPVPLDPWARETETLGDPAEAQPMCLRCLEPHPEGAEFCPHCCAPVGQFNNYNPYLYLFSLGDVLRTGTTGPLKRSWITVTGLVLLSLTQYVFLAPIYWILLAVNWRRQHRALTPPGRNADA